MEAAFGMRDSDLWATVWMVSIGFLWNTQNLVVTVHDNMKMKNFQTISLVISSISLSNMFLELTTFALVALVKAGLFCQREVHPILKVVIFLWLHSSSVSFWSIAWMSVFYCVKIVNASSLFIKMIKKNITTIIKTTLVLTPLASALMSFPYLLLEGQNYSSVTAASNYTQNGTCVWLIPVFPLWINMEIYTFIFISFLCPFPLIIMLFTSIKLVIYLFGHTMSLKRNKTEVQRMDSYLQVCRLTVSLVGVYLINLAIVALFFVARMANLDLSVVIIIASYSFYCTATAIILTASNKDLKEKLLAILCCTKNGKAVGDSSQSMKATSA